MPLSTLVAGLQRRLDVIAEAQDPDSSATPVNHLLVVAEEVDLAIDSLLRAGFDGDEVLRLLRSSDSWISEARGRLRVAAEAVRTEFDE